MLRYIIGVSLIAAAIMLIRRLAGGRMLRRHQYALWLLIPLYMIASPFIKINVPVAEEISNLIPANVEQVIYENVYSNDVLLSAEVENNDASDMVFEMSGEQNIAFEKDVREGSVAGVPSKTPVNTGLILNVSYISVAATLIILLTVYNAGFVIFCRRNRKYLGTDPKSGLGIYGISHRGVPFLLFNKIYVEEDPSAISEYAICHEACHYKHGDFIWVIIRHLVLALNWYNPLIWAAFILSGRDCELACDEEVVSVYGSGSAEKYAEDLLMLMQRKSDSSYRFSMTTGMKSGYKSMRRRLLSLKHPARTSYKAIALSLAALIVVSGFSVLDPKAAEHEQSIIDELVSEAVIDAPVKLEAPFDYETSVPVVKQTYDRIKDITFYRDGSSVKARLSLPEGAGPFKTVVMRGKFGSDYSLYSSVVRILNENGYAALQIKNTHESEIISRSGGSGDKTFSDVYFKQVLDFYAVIDEMRYIPDIDMDNIYLWGHEIGGVIALYTGIERQSEFKGMIIVQPELSSNQYLEFSKDPKLAVRLYEMLPECYTPTVILEPRNQAESMKAVDSMPDAKLILFDYSQRFVDDKYIDMTAENTIEALKFIG